MIHLTLTLQGLAAGCPPIKCGLGGTVALRLVDAAFNKTFDGAGWINGTIVEEPAATCAIGISNWVYVLHFEDTEFSAEFLDNQLGDLTAADISSVCCTECGIQMILDRMVAPSIVGYKRESFRLHADNEIIATGSTRLFRMHRPLLISAIEISCEEHLTGYPYAANPGEINVGLLASPGQQQGPAAVLSALEATIDPASTQPLSARRDFVPPLLVPSGAGVWANVDCADPEAHKGLEVHIDFQVQPES